jgi:protein-tyrosine phosphatase
VTDQSIATAVSLQLSAARNARDLGGYRTTDGRTVRYGTALRGDALTRLTDEDVAALARLGLRTVVDLRGSDEVEANGPDRLPESPGAPIRTLHLPVFESQHDIYATLQEALSSRDAAAQRAVLGDGGGERMMVEMYRWFVTHPGNRGRFAEVLRLLADPEGVPLFFHCVAGKDRTGWAAALLLTALGVDRATVYEDYLLTNERSAHTVETILTSFRTRGLMEEPELMLPLLRAEPAYLDAAFAAVEEGWPSFGAFLADGLGLDDAVLGGLRRNLLSD